MRFIPTLFVTVLVMAALIALDIAKPLGAHPWWSQKTLMIGAPIGVILAALSPVALRPQPRILFFALTLAAFGIAKYGQTQFAASYAEDALAGRLWYFGWIATGGAIAGWLMSVLRAKRRSNP